MNKIDKYLRRFAYKIETSETKESRYYTIGDLIVRVSNHIGKNSSGNISIIIDRNNYILYVPSTNKVSLISYEECKTLIRVLYYMLLYFWLEILHIKKVLLRRMKS